MNAGYGKNFNLEKCRVERVIIMADADPDGAHIRTLWLRFFSMYCAPLVEAGRLFAALPPLYAIPEKKGYSFIGWKDANGEYVEGHYKVEGTTTLKADYRLKFIVTFVYNNGEENTTQEVVENQMAIAPKEPIKNGYEFDGWYYNGIKYNFDKVVSSNITLEARWK